MTNLSDGNLTHNLQFTYLYRTELYCSHPLSPNCTYWLPNDAQESDLPAMGLSWRGGSFLQSGTKTLMYVCPLSRNQSTASWIPQQENTSLFP